MVIALMAGVALGACADEADGPPGGDDVTTTTDDGGGGGDDDGGGAMFEGAGGPVETVSLGAGLSADLPASADAEVTPFAPAVDRPDVDGCAPLSARVEVGDAGLELYLNDTACSAADPREAGNGDHGSYVTIDDVSDPGHVAEHPSAAGDLVTFTQGYFECTNSCADFTDHVGLLALDAPPDPDRPAVMLLSAQGEVAMEDIVTLADAIHPE